MSTEKQIEANRRNAQLSTGPKTDAGKTATSRNALKHGLLAQKHVLLDESPDAFTQFVDGFLADLAPATPMETHLAKIVATTAFRLQRVPRIETEMFNARMTKFTDAPYNDNPLGAAFTYNASDAIKTLTRYESSLNRQFNAALKQLTALKTTRLGSPPPSSLSNPFVETQCLASPVSPPSNAPLPNKPNSVPLPPVKELSPKELLDLAEQRPPALDSLPLSAADATAGHFAAIALPNRANRLK